MINLPRAKNPDQNMVIAGRTWDILANAVERADNLGVAAPLGLADDQAGKLIFFRGSQVTRFPVRISGTSSAGGGSNTGYTWVQVQLSATDGTATDVSGGRTSDTNAGTVAFELNQNPVSGSNTIAFLDQVFDSDSGKPSLSFSVGGSAGLSLSPCKIIADWTPNTGTVRANVYTASGTPGTSVVVLDLVAPRGRIPPFADVLANDVMYYLAYPAKPTNSSTTAGLLMGVNQIPRGGADYQLYQRLGNQVVIDDARAR